MTHNSAPPSNSGADLCQLSINRYVAFKCIQGFLCLTFALIKVTAVIVLMLAVCFFSWTVTLHLMSSVRLQTHIYFNTLGFTGSC